MGTPGKAPEHLLAQTSIEARAQMKYKIEQADFFAPVAVDRFQVVRHRGKGFWVEFDGFQIATLTAEDALFLIDAINDGLFSAAYLSSRATVRHQGRLLVDINPPHSMTDEIETFRSILSSNDLKVVYNGSYALEPNISRLAAIVTPN